MSCLTCESDNQVKFTPETMLHFHGLGNVDNPGVLVSHGVVVCGIILDHRPPVIVDLDRFLKVLVINRPGFGSFTRSESHVGCGDLPSLRANVLPQQLDVPFARDLGLCTCPSGNALRVRKYRNARATAR